MPTNYTIEHTKKTLNHGTTQKGSVGFSSVGSVVKENLLYKTAKNRGGVLRFISLNKLTETLFFMLTKQTALFRSSYE